MLSPKQTLSAQHPDVRIDAATLDQFTKLCKKAGTSTYAGVRQLIAAYLDKPFKLHKAKKGEVRGAKIPGVRDTQARVLALKSKATTAGVSHGEAIRQIVHRYIDQGKK